MPNIVKQRKKGLTADELARLQHFVDKVKAGEVVPFKAKTDKARKNLKKARLIK